METKIKDFHSYLQYEEYLFYKNICSSYFASEEIEKSDELENRIYELKELFGILVSLQDYKRMYEEWLERNTEFTYQDEKFRLCLPKEITAFFTINNGYPLWYYLREKEFMQGRKKLLFLYSVPTEDILAILEIGDGSIWYSLRSTNIDNINIIEEWIRNYASRKGLHYGCKWLEDLARKGYLGAKNRTQQFIADTMRTGIHDNNSFLIPDTT